MSAIGPLRTSLDALHMSPFDPKRTCHSRGRISAFGQSGSISKGDMGDAVTHESTEFPHAHLPVRLQRWCIVGPHECHGGTATHMRLQYFEQRGGEPISPLRFDYANRAIKVAVGRSREIAQHSLDDRDMRFCCECWS